jgi:hypothetical protein
MESIYEMGSILSLPHNYEAAGQHVLAIIYTDEVQARAEGRDI